MLESYLDLMELCREIATEIHLHYQNLFYYGVNTVKDRAALSLVIWRYLLSNLLWCPVSNFENLQRLWNILSSVILNPQPFSFIASQLSGSWQHCHVAGASLVARLASHSVTLLGWHALLVLLQERAGHQTTPPYPWHPPHPHPTSKPHSPPAYAHKAACQR